MVDKSIFRGYNHFAKENNRANNNMDDLLEWNKIVY